MFSQTVSVLDNVSVVLVELKLKQEGTLGLAQLLAEMLGQRIVLHWIYINKFRDKQAEQRHAWLFHAYLWHPHRWVAVSDLTAG